MDAAIGIFYVILTYVSDYCIKKQGTALRGERVAPLPIQGSEHPDELARIRAQWCYIGVTENAVPLHLVVLRNVPDAW